MNLFVVAYAGRGDAGSEERLRFALDGLSAELPYFPGRPVGSWRAPSGRLACAWVSHGADQTGGAAYVTSDDSRVALFSGRPFLWRGDIADGTTPIDATFYSRASEDELLDLDGRFVALRFDDAEGGLDLVTDPIGAYPVFETDVDGTTLVSNNAELLRRLRGTGEFSLESVATLVCGGWPLSGDPLWRDVRRVESFGVHRLRPGGRSLRQGFDWNDPQQVLGSEFDVDRAAGIVVQSIRGLADWPGRPSVVPVTAGRDSRVILGAAVASGIDVRTVTFGSPGHPDVRVGRELAERVGAPHLIDVAAVDPRSVDWREAARVVNLMASGTTSLADARGYRIRPLEGPLVLWHSGQGGEIARGAYGSGAGLDAAGVADMLYRKFAVLRFYHRSILSRAGEHMVRDSIRSWVDEQRRLGFELEDVPDLFYLKKRMGGWAGPGHGCVEYFRDTTSPLWSHRLVPDELGLASEQRMRELFHLEVLRRVEPRLVNIGFEIGKGWPADHGNLRLRLKPYAELLPDVPGEFRRRLVQLSSRVLPNGGTGREPSLGRSLPAIRDFILRRDDHPAWEALDRGRVRRLLESHPDALDFFGRTHVWHLLTVFAAGEHPV